MKYFRLIIWVVILGGAGIYYFFFSATAGGKEVFNKFEEQILSGEVAYTVYEDTGNIIKYDGKDFEIVLDEERIIVTSEDSEYEEVKEYVKSYLDYSKESLDVDTDPFEGSDYENSFLEDKFNTSLSGEYYLYTGEIEESNERFSTYVFKDGKRLLDFSDMTYLIVIEE